MTKAIITSALALMLAACGSIDTRTTPQDVHPGDLVRQQKQAAS